LQQLLLIISLLVVFAGHVMQGNILSFSLHLLVAMKTTYVHMQILCYLQDCLYTCSRHE